MADKKNTQLCGVINLLKPPGLSSQAAVNAVRRMTGAKKAGHCGTLDPGASGVLPVLLNKATRLSRYLIEKDKYYRAEITLGFISDTGDSFGNIYPYHSAENISQEMIESVLTRFRGEIMQVPPMTSAIKVGGRKLYELAREGVNIEREARAVNIYELELVDMFEQNSPHPRVLLDVHCSKGTYIRSLAMDIGQALGTGSYMSFLLRRRAGCFSIHEAFTLEEIGVLCAERKWEQLIIDPAVLFEKWGSVTVDEAEEPYIIRGNCSRRHKSTDQGRKISAIGIDERLLILNPQKRLLAIAKVTGDEGSYCLQPEIVLAESE